MTAEATLKPDVDSTKHLEMWHCFSLLVVLANRGRASEIRAIPQDDAEAEQREAVGVPRHVSQYSWHPCPSLFLFGAQAVGCQQAQYVYSYCTRCLMSGQFWLPCLTCAEARTRDYRKLQSCFPLTASGPDETQPKRAHWDLTSSLSCQSSLFHEATRMAIKVLVSTPFSRS